jgi:hypothetical protein
VCLVLRRGNGKCPEPTFLGKPVDKWFYQGIIPSDIQTTGQLSLFAFSDFGWLRPVAAAHREGGENPPRSRHCDRYESRWVPLPRRIGVGRFGE